MLRLLTSLLISCLVPIFTVLAITIDEFQGDQAAEAGFQSTDSSVIVVPDMPGGMRSSAIGGTREAHVNGINGSTFIKTRLLIGLDSLIHSQDSGASGVSRIVWDADQDLTTLDPIGLGGVDFTQDGSTAIRLIVTRFDSPFGEPILLKLRVYTDSGNYSEVEHLITSSISSPTAIDFPFTSFASIAGSGTDFTSVGAIELTINENLHSYDSNLYPIDPTHPEDIDFRLSWIGTDSGCDHVPDDSLKVVDECGVCDGDNTTCADCLGVPNGTAVPGTPCDNGELGVCDGGTFNQNCACIRNEDPSPELCDDIDNDCDGQIDEDFSLKNQECGIGSGLCEFKGTYICDDNQTGLKCDDAALLQDLVDDCEESKGCDDVPGSGLVIDQCGICGGDGKSCLDCQGTVNGSAKPDRCGVCEGDGNSCLGCNEVDQTSTLRRLDNGAKKQEKLVNRLGMELNRVDEDPAVDRFIQRQNAQAAALQLRNWELSWELPHVATQCSNLQFCTAVSNLGTIDAYKQNSRRLRRMSFRIMRRIRAAYGGQLPKRLKRIARRIGILHNANMVLIDTVPENQSSCT